MPVIHWFRRDLRLADNTALHRASRVGQVVPVYILSKWKGSHEWTGPKRQQFLAGCLHSLAANLEHLGSRLVIRAGDAVEELERIAVETRASAIHFNRVPDPAGRGTEARLRQMCVRLGIGCESFKDAALHEPHEVLTGAGTPYRVYTPYSKAWLAMPKEQPVPRVTSLGPAPAIQSLPVPTLEHWSMTLPASAKIPPAGERAARDRMRRFFDGGVLARYNSCRDLPNADATSMLSQDLRFGLISVRELCQRAMKAGGESAVKFIKELAWREFYMAILHHWPEVLEHEFNPDWRGLWWPGTEDHFTAWCQARTGFPIVDAGMRQLLATGLMHNRVRMIVAMFLTKDLHCDWRLGEQFFHQHLIDAEIGSNNGGWQWSAGTGADAAPYFRIQNPWLQTKRHDPAGDYIKRWLPELRDVPAARLHAPPGEGVPLALAYPLPIVDHATERSRTLSLFAAHKARR
jgi:deoxyribodipyrimidine photo-lyase